MNSFRNNIIARIKAIKNDDQTTLLGIWNGRNLDEWNESEEIYILIGERALVVGDPILAFDIINEGLLNWPDNIRLMTLKGLALARCGAEEKANLILEKLYSNGCRDEEVLGILARTHKDLWISSSQLEKKQFHIRRCAELYAEAYQRHKSYWTGINASTFALINGNKTLSHSWASEVYEMCLREIRDGQTNDYWLYATLGESSLILGNLDQAKDWYRKASLSFDAGYGNLASTRRNALLVLSEMGISDKFLNDCFPRPRVVVFTGHMVDVQNRQLPRFPADRTQAVYDEIQTYLKDSGAKVGFASAACGSDILFLEAMLNLGGEVNIVLPSSRDSFIKTSVEFAQGGDWKSRFDRVIQRAKSVLTASEDIAGDVSYSYANIVLYGLAKSYARHIDANLIGLAVWDGEDGKLGGTGSAIQQWDECGLSVSTIHPVSLKLSKPYSAGVSQGQDHLFKLSQPNQQADYSANFVSILFADVVGFSKFSERLIPIFVTHFLGAIGNLLEKNEYAPLMRNTWGDGLYFVFKDAHSAGIVGLEIRRLIDETDWSEVGLPKDLNIRIGLHSGPAYRFINPITKQLDFTGTHVSRAARIEPITPPGEVFASQAFAAISEATGEKDFACDYVGQTSLAKKYGVFPTYRVRPVN